MAGPLETIAVAAPPTRQEDYEGPLGGLGWGLAWLDYGVYTLEYIAVVVAMVAMTIIEFVYIVSLYATELRIVMAQRADPDLDAPFPWSGVVLLGFIALMMGAVVQSTRLGRDAEDAPRPLPVRLGLTAALTAAVGGLVGLTVWLESSSSFYLMLAVLVMGPSTAFFFQAAREASDEAGRRSYQLKGVLMVGLSVGALWLAWTVPDGYSWADKRALFLLLWVGFLGASMAAKQQRHLKIDIARKLCPEAWLARFNGVSYTVAALFTATMTYLGYVYLFNPDYGRFWVSTIPGEIPDWFKVASIPVALLLITLRFGARGVSLLIWGDAVMPKPPPPLVPEPDDASGDDPLAADGAAGSGEGDDAKPDGAKSDGAKPTASKPTASKSTASKSTASKSDGAKETPRAASSSSGAGAKTSKGGKKKRKKNKKKRR